ncbi:hypothetical protein [Achromobacter insolitus]|uniref:hypothetical protein n=1 Tax=Achromobacter insolitus TaxID=217204 RepID=UPI0005376B3A|nr:hypothetical protein [Achromobacter insolitus]AVG41540.1 hypothetical protein MC81_20350 [Achromobacter insolitus]
MNAIVSIKFDTDGVSEKALRVLRAAVAIASENQGLRLQVVSCQNFCERAGLPRGTGVLELGKLFGESMKVLGTLEVLSMEPDSLSEDVWGSWPPYDSIAIVEDRVEFEICAAMFRHDAWRSLFEGECGRETSKPRMLSTLSPC